MGGQNEQSKYTSAWLLIPNLHNNNNDLMVMIRCIGSIGNNGNNDIVGSNNEIITIVMVFRKVQKTDESQVTLSKLWPAAWLGGRAGTKSANST